MTASQVLGRAVTLPGRRPSSIGQRRRRRVMLVWALLVLNVLTFYTSAAHLIPMPGAVGKGITQFALIAALLLALSVNRPAVVRPSVFLLLLALLAAEALMTSPRAEFLVGALYRSGRLLVFVAVLWMLTPWWGRRDLLLVKAHLLAVWLVLGSVVLGFALAPGMALTENRLTGVLWPIPPTQVAHYAAVAAGLTIVLWLSGLVRRGPALVASVSAVLILVLSHTRTALVALIAGVMIAGFSLFSTRSRVRRAFVAGLVLAGIVALTLSSFIATWLARGQDTDQVTALTGRRAVWEAVVAQPRSLFETLFGFGLSNKSFEGLPIDSNWLATYFDLGLVGVTVNVSMLLFLLIAAMFRPHGPMRALALFLVAYCTMASFTETGLSDASPYVLELALAASLLVAPTSQRSSP